MQAQVLSEAEMQVYAARSHAANSAHFPLRDRRSVPRAPGYANWGIEDRDWPAQLASLCEQQRIPSRVKALLAVVLDHACNAAVAQERARLAREVHDGITQAFIGINMLLSCPSVEAADAVRRAQQLAQVGLDESRRTIHELVPSALMTGALDQAVRRMAEATVPASMGLRVHGAGDWQGFAPEQACELFRMIQEAVNNAVRHSRASCLEIDLSCTSSEAVALICDNGRGFDVETHREVGFGLASMRQRAASCRTSLEIRSAPGNGTQVYMAMKRKSVREDASACRTISGRDENYSIK